MDFNTIATLILGILIIAGLAAVLILSRRRCPECHSLKISEINRESQGMRAADMHTGGEGGGYSSTQIIYKVKFHCGDCQTQWTEIVTETR